MKKITVLFLCLLFAFLGFSTASAAPVVPIVNLFDWAFNVDGDTYEDVLGDSMPTTGLLDAYGLGTLTWATNVAGSHSFIAFFDHEIDEAINTFYNEYGVAVNMPEATQTWEIDEPGYSFGDIYEHVTGWNEFDFDYTGTIGLDNTNAVPQAVPQAAPNDVSWAMGWDFTLDPGYKADIRLILSDNINDISQFGFYMAQVDPDSSETIYFSSDLALNPEQYVIPEPGTMILLGTGLAGLAGLRRRKFKR